MENLVEAQVYIWIAPLSLLIPELWSYDTFIRDSAHKWVGPGEDVDENYKEVDRRRQKIGTELQKSYIETIERLLTFSRTRDQSFREV